MAEYTFNGGVTPPDGKAYSKDCGIQTLFPQNGVLNFPLKQHIGSPAQPVVREGDYVRTGQLIAAAQEDLSANLHASVSGRVVGLSECPLADGTTGQCLQILNDGTYLEVSYPDKRRLETLNRETVLRAIQSAGIVGMGGAGLPTHVKLMSGDADQIDTVIANCIECEPYLTSDYRRTLENPWKIISGLMILLTVFPRARGIIAVSDKNEKGYRQLRELLEDHERISVKRCSSKYPQGSERQLIYALTGRTLNATMLPADIGCIVNNTDTLIAINQAVIMHEPLITRIITVTGDGVVAPGNFRVRLGMTYRDILEQAGGLAKGITLDDVVVLNGGPMTGNQMSNLDVPVTKLSTGIVVLKRENLPQREVSACTRCARCVDACPNNLVPLQLYDDITHKRTTAFIRHGGLECCSCGCCSYSCPSNIPLAAQITGVKETIMRRPRLAGDYARRYMH
ncbi:MAG TPA: electron transport complex subunit RsxC [Lachnospiraceae bacterium]|jgi:electron transport complex protein RnfC|nr:electron transport complex subunit RsxC [Lachnospiraceae bacterium]